MKTDSAPRQDGSAAPRSDLQAEIVRQILDLLREQRPAPGTRLPEQRLARQIGVSRTPVRNAMRYLEEQGYFTSERGRGFIVSRLPGSASEADEALPESRIVMLYDELLKDRATGHLGAEVSEAELAGRYGVSRAVLARALARLASQGLITRQRGHGWRFVDALESEQAYEESYEFRVAVECAALSSARFRPDAGRLAEMRRRHEAILAAPESVEPRDWFETNAAFHEMIAEFSGNRFFQQAVRYQNDLRRLREHAEFSHITRTRIEQSCREHLAVIEAIDQQDREWAAALLRRHLLQAFGYSGLPESETKS